MSGAAHPEGQASDEVPHCRKSGAGVVVVGTIDVVVDVVGAIDVLVVGSAASLHTCYRTVSASSSVRGAAVASYNSIDTMQTR